MMSPDWPSLPTIDDPELLLQVYTHKSLQFEEQENVQDIGNNERLEDLGAKVLELAITQRLFSKKPLLSAEELADKRKNFLSDDNLHDWVTAYSMVKNLKSDPTKREEIKTPTESRTLLYTYLGAVYCRKGLPPISTWISGLVEPDAAPSTPLQQCLKFPPQPQDTPPRLPSAPTSAADSPQGGLSILSLFNEHCQKNQIKIDWDQQSSGLPHQMQWTVRCIVNGSERGVGIASNTKVAKGLAARDAARSMGLAINV